MAGNLKNAQELWSNSRIFWENFEETGDNFSVVFDMTGKNAETYSEKILWKLKIFWKIWISFEDNLNKESFTKNLENFRKKHENFS